MTFIKWLREEKGYNIRDDYDIMEQLSAVEADILWQEWDNAHGWEEEDG
jgi:hypothetical protein